VPNNLLALPAHDGSSLYVARGGAGRWGRPSRSSSVRPPPRPSATSTSERRRTGSPASPRPRWTGSARTRRGWRVDVEVRNPVTGYRFLLDTGHGPQWLNAAGVSRRDVPDATDFRLLSYDPPPGWAADAAVYQIFPDRFARSDAAAGRPLPDWAIPCELGHAGDRPRDPRRRTSSTAATSTGVTEHLDHLSALGREHGVPDADLPGPVQPPLRRVGRSTGWIRCSGGDEALAPPHRGRARARAAGVLGDLTTNHCGRRPPRGSRPPSRRGRARNCSTSAGFG
jgi:alpha-glucosidase